jgi:hypothetical protein
MMMAAIERCHQYLASHGPIMNSSLPMQRLIASNASVKVAVYFLHVAR